MYDISKAIRIDRIELYNYVREIVHRNIVNKLFDYIWNSTENQVYYNIKYNTIDTLNMRDEL